MQLVRTSDTVAVDAGEEQEERIRVGMSKVLARGQITLPRDVRHAAGIAPGDNLLLRVVGPGRVELTVLPRLTLDEALAKYHIEGPINEEEDRARWQERAAEDVIGGRDG